MQCIGGVERAIVVRESDVIMSGLFSDDVNNNVTRVVSNDSVSYADRNLCCIYGNCSCPSLYNALANVTGNVLINITTDVELSSRISLSDLVNIKITGHNNPTVKCSNSGGLNFKSCVNCTITGINWRGFRNISDGRKLYPVLQLHNSSNIAIKNCSFHDSMGQAVALSGVSGDVNINHCNFFYNKQHDGHGTAIHYSSIALFSSLKLTISYCKFFHNEGSKSIVYFGQSSNNKSHEYLYLQNSNFYHNKGVPIYLTNQNLFITGNTEFYGNSAEDGAAIFISDHSNVTFHNSAVVNFRHNTANKNGGAIFLTNHSNIIFKEHSTSYQYPDNQLHNDTLVEQYGKIFVTFHTNTANGLGQDIYICSSNITVSSTAVVIFDTGVTTNGSAVYTECHSNITFEGDSKTTFTNYTVANGPAMYITDYSAITFKENSTVALNNNKAFGNGGAMYVTNHSTVRFGGNSTVVFNNNKASSNGGAMYIGNYSTIKFGGNCIVVFKFNGAQGKGGAMFAVLSSIIFEGNSTVAFNYNKAENGGAVYIYGHSITFEGNSALAFEYNTAFSNGGALCIRSTITFKANSVAVFNNNKALSNGGVMYTLYSLIRFEGNSTVTLNSNVGYNNGGGMCFADYSMITFEGNSTVTLHNNEGSGNGGAVYIANSSTITFKGHSKVLINSSKTSGKGGAIHITRYSSVNFEGNSIVVFTNNHALSNDGGAIYIFHKSTVTFTGDSAVALHNNDAYTSGGGVYINDNSHITFEGSSTVKFYANKARYDGGAVYVDHNSALQFKDTSTVMFYNNSAYLGGSIFVVSSQISIEGNCSIEFTKNTALQDGGAIYLSDHSYFTALNNSIVTFDYNLAGDFGGAIYALLKTSSMNFNSSSIYFKDNTAGTTQKPVYINVYKSCDSVCVFYSVSINKKSIPFFATSPSKLILYNPSKCIHGNDTVCYTYYMNNIMLGQEITLDACLLDYYDQPIEAAQFLLTGMNHHTYNYNISGSKYITVECNHTTRGISITGNLHSNISYNYSIVISLNVARISESKIVSVNLIVELSQCYPGFWYSKESQKCECYNIQNIISCSGSNSIIKRGYWFGSVTGKPTVTTCPNVYCNFTCCETTNGYYQLSPNRANQCRPHRSGTACGNCEKGYTLSFDSPQCIGINKCTIGWTILVTLLSMLYWVTIVTAVFIMMYFKITIGSLYAVMYYYSIIDILLSQDYFISNKLYTTINIMSSLAKLTPKFLGQLCLVKSMSGIDQQFIHYMHPVFVSLILIMISKLARGSRKFSSFISRGIIPFICFLLLLSYTSVTATSLLLMRPLIFIDIDKIYTYLSPDIEYCHGRHLVYVIVAVLFTIIIVIGFPLLLLLEPFLNSKINFVKIKPLLDQFQCCYKDKYRCFAAYYMICRLVIILLIIVKIFDEFTTQYLLISTCALMELLHVLVRPYASAIHNIFDGIILQLIVIISVLPTVELVDDHHETLVLVVTYFVIILPLATFFAIKLWINRNNIQNIFNNWTIKFLHNYKRLPNEEPTDMTEIGITVDDSMRKNTTVVDM